MNLTIGWLYPDLMSIYGDRGNIICLQKRCEWRGIAVDMKRLDLDFSAKDLLACDLLFMGGAQDRQQTIVAEDIKKKKLILQGMIEKEIPGLYICGAYQFLGKYYKEADGSIVEGLSIFDLYTENPGEKAKRLIGNVAIKVQNSKFKVQSYLVGFENHGGRTYLGKNIEPLGEVISGYGNNGKDGYEGAIYKNSIGSYSHGPILPKNPQLADWLIQKALEIRYKKKHTLESLDDSLAKKARDAVLKKLHIS